MNQMNRAQRPGVTSIEAAETVMSSFRMKRLGMFIDLVAGAGIQGRPIRVLDIGGTQAYWEESRGFWKHLPLEITIVNIGAPSSDASPYHLRGGDACAMPEYGDGAFDVVHSNSVIEHVGHWDEMAAMAREVRRLAPRYFLQVPDFWFPFEPHYRTLFFHWLPESVRASLLTRRKFGFCGPEPTFDAAMRSVQAIKLLTARQLAELFPDARIAHERVLGFSKSLIAIRDRAGVTGG